MASTNDRFVEAESHWDLKTLYADLAAVKGKPLTPVEKL
ncbi:MAG: helix-turn-helix domain-containing protein, partial [Oscillatoriales cyanobacterium]